MKVIKTKFHGPTDTLESRISAATEDGRRIYVDYDPGLMITENHERAAKKLVLKITGKDMDFYMGEFNDEFIWLIKRT